MTRIENLCNMYRDNKRLIEALTADNENIKSEIIQSMNGRDEVIAGVNKITYKEYNSGRIDSKQLKNDHPEIYNDYYITSSIKRFSIK